MDYSSQQKDNMPPNEPSNTVYPSLEKTTMSQPENIGFTSQEPPPMYTPAQPPQPTPPTNVVYMIGQPQVGPDPTTLNCPHCHATVTSRVEQEATAKTHLICLLLCCIGCCCCAPLVYCSDGCLAKKHTCPNCNQFLGVYDG